jgi:radical SAM protein with 4Fe4S-binding SPASM domain
MSYTKFELASGQQFYYDSHHNKIYNQKAEQLNLPPLRSLDWYEEEEKNHGVTNKVNNPIAIRILLGHACNYNCTYCMQKDIGNPSERPQSIYTETFIANINRNLNLDRLRRVELWGGEPFLYWKDMVQLMTFFDSSDREFFISTNGSAFVQKHVDFFRTLKARVLISLSHDAVGQEKLRGEDILKKPNKVDIIKQLIDLPNVGLGFSTVVSNDNHDLYAINDYFKDFCESQQIDRKRMKITFIPAKNYDVHDTGEASSNYILRGEKLKAFTSHLFEFTQHSINDLDRVRFLKNNVVYSEEGVVEYAKFLRQVTPITTKSGCGADSNDILSVDIQGNVRLCPHTDGSFIAGRLEEVSKVEIKGMDILRKKTHCMKCPVKRLCRSSCPIKFPDHVFYSNCALEKVWWGNIQLHAFQMLFNQKVTMKEVGLDEIEQSAN